MVTPLLNAKWASRGDNILVEALSDGETSEESYNILSSPKTCPFDLLPATLDLADEKLGKKKTNGKINIMMIVIGKN